jgi:hypothetical protein
MIESGSGWVGSFGFWSAGSNGVRSVVVVVRRTITSVIFLYPRVNLVMMCFFHVSSLRRHHCQSLLWAVVGNTSAPVTNSCSFHATDNKTKVQLGLN